MFFSIENFSFGILRITRQCFIDNAGKPERGENKNTQNNKINTDFKKFKYKKFIIDPGIGFGKNLKHNLILMNKISLFHSLGFPLLIGTSRKRFINQISGSFDSKERIGGTLASVLYTLSQGVQIFRVHNVHEVKQAILVFKKIIST